MGFFGIGTGELILILVIALIIWGPGKLPEIARTLGRAVRVLRKATSDFTSEITKEIDQEEKTAPQDKSVAIKRRHHQPEIKHTHNHKDDQSRSLEGHQ
ncbi:MAG: TatA/E family twin arginine-targeting protein translocase [Dehalococcoidales bacterium]